MKHSRGFTLIEIIVTVTVMVTLMALAVVALRSTQANGRDQERKMDVESIARSLEQRYNNGATYVNHDGNTITWSKGAYPGHSEMWDYMYYQVPPLDKALPGTTKALVTSPGGNRMDAFCWFYFWDPTCDVAEKDSIIQNRFSNGSGGYRDIYFYEFIGADGRYCGDNSCTRYNIYWISETDQTVYKGIPGLKVYKSKHR